MVTTLNKSRAQNWTWSGARFVRQTPSEKQIDAPKPSLLYKRARYYDPNTGEFVSRDPLEYIDGMSLYRGYFVPGTTDPLGKKAVGKIGFKLSMDAGTIDGNLKGTPNSFWGVNAKISWQEFDHDPMDEPYKPYPKSKCGCKNVKFYQIVITQQYYKNEPKTSYGNNIWHDDTKALSKKGLLIESTPESPYAYLSDDPHHPNPGKMSDRYNTLIKLRQLFESCAVCTDKKSARFKEVFGCVRWGHEIKRDNNGTTHKYWGTNANAFETETVTKPKTGPQINFEVPGSGPTIKFLEIMNSDYSSGGGKFRW